MNSKYCNFIIFNWSYVSLIWVFTYEICWWRKWRHRLLWIIRRWNWRYWWRTRWNWCNWMTILCLLHWIHWILWRSYCFWCSIIPFKYRIIASCTEKMKSNMILVCVECPYYWFIWNFIESSTKYIFIFNHLQHVTDRLIWFMKNYFKFIQVYTLNICQYLRCMCWWITIFWFWNWRTFTKFGH